METNQCHALGALQNIELESKYRDIADGNCIQHDGMHEPHYLLESKYRDIADGNSTVRCGQPAAAARAGNQVPRYSGYKSIAAREQFLPVRQLAPTMTDKIKVGSA